MLRIGVFSMLSKISIHMLRHYDEIGLLKPETIDSFTGYRYYSESQLPVANQIQAFKDMGFGLMEIKRLLTEINSPEELEKHLERHIELQNQEMAAIQQRIVLLQTALKRVVAKTDLPHYGITLKEIPTRAVIAYKGVAQTHNQEGALWIELAKEAQRQQVRFSEPSYNIALYQDEGYRDSNISIEVQRSVTGKYKNTEKFQYKIVEPIIAATNIYKGKYELLRDATEQLVYWIVNNGYAITGNLFNIYHVSPETEREPEKMVTEVCLPVSPLK